METDFLKFFFSVIGFFSLSGLLFFSQFTLFITMLRVGYQNVHHLYNKVIDLCVFLSQSTPCYIIFGITGSRLGSRISDQDINIPNRCISRNGSTVIGQTGIAVYIRNSIADITHRRQDLESDLVESIWLELKPSTNAPNFFLFLFSFSFSYEWFDNFVHMIDNIHTVKPHADILVLEYFNIDLLKPHSFWDSTVTLLGLT